MNSDNTEQELVRSAKAGDHDAFRKIIKKHEKQVASTIIGMLGYCSEAEDIGQETFLRFFRSVRNFRGDSTIGTYITRIAINLCLNEIKTRAQKRAKYYDYETPMDTLVSPSSNIEINDEKKIIHQGLQKLKRKYRTVIVLRLIDGYSTEETAEILRLPVGTVLSRLARGQKKLKEILSPLIRDGYA